jgi:hypothetical protein
MMKTLEYLTGITGAECRRLRALGIKHTNQLLHSTSLIADRQRLSRKTGMSEERLLELANQCALLEISGMERYQKPVWRLGITSLKDLKRQEPNDLHRRLEEVLGYGAAPNLPQVEYWVSQARSIDMIEQEDEVSAQEGSPSLLASAETTRRSI